jgi:hypothetical protein
MALFYLFGGTVILLMLVLPHHERVNFEDALLNGYLATAQRAVRQRTTNSAGSAGVLTCSRTDPALRSGQRL